MSTTAPILYPPEIGDLLRDYLSVIVARLDESGKILYASRPAESMFGVQMINGMIGTCVEDYIPDDKVGKHPQYRKEYAQLPRVRMMGAGSDLMAKRVDGTLFPVEVSLIPANLSGIACVVVLIFDMTGRVRAKKDSDPNLKSPAEPSSKKGK